MAADVRGRDGASCPGPLWAENPFPEPLASPRSVSHAVLVGGVVPCLPGRVYFQIGGSFQAPCSPLLNSDPIIQQLSQDDEVPRTLLVPHSVTAALLDLESSKSSGVLEVRHESLTALIYVHRGVPVFAEQGALAHSIGRTLLRKRLLSEDQYRSVIEHMTDKVFESEQIRFGEVAVTLGFVTHEQVNEALEDQVRQRILACLAWENAECRYYANAEAATAVVHYPCRVPELIGMAVELYYDESRVVRELSPFAAFCPRLTFPEEMILKRFRLPSTVRPALALMNGSKRIAFLLQDAGEGGAELGQLLVTLIVGRVVALEPTSGVELVEAPASDPAPPGHSLTSSPPVPRSLAPPPVPEAGIDDRPTEVEPLRFPTAPPPPKARASRLWAERLFRRGKRELTNGAPINRAVAKLRKASELCPDVIEYSVHAEWAELLGTADEHLAQQQRTALEASVDRALREDPRFAFGYYVKGRLLLIRGEEQQAMRAFRKCVQLDPNDRDAERYLRVLRSRRGA